ncbi:MAG TPA: DNA-binding response regulator [Firmicutes bacterium]|jgi:two-component system, NarL family, response regulator DegU|nr:DNA-binding response regulator [Bacillota bacterium]
MAVISLFIVADFVSGHQSLKGMLSSEKDFMILDEIQFNMHTLGKIIAVRPDVVLINTNLVGNDGLELTAELKQKSPLVKVLIVTEDTNQHHLSKSIKAGALGYILMDSDLTILFEAIRTVARGDAYIQPCLLSTLLAELRQFLSEEKQVVLPEQLGLTQREFEIVNHIACGSSNKEIAERLFISEKTVKNHVSNILRKMELEDRTQVAVYAYRKGLIAK